MNHRAGARVRAVSQCDPPMGQAGGTRRGASVAIRFGNWQGLPVLSYDLSAAALSIHGYAGW
jgi:hypothetical protein